jgi:hypothetical protein
LTGVRITSALDEVASKTLDLVSGHAAEFVAEHIEGEWAGRLVDAFLPFRLRHDPSTHAAGPASRVGCESVPGVTERFYVRAGIGQIESGLAARRLLRPAAMTAENSE